MLLTCPNRYKLQQFEKLVLAFRNGDVRLFDEALEEHQVASSGEGREQLLTLLLAGFLRAEGDLHPPPQAEALRVSRQVDTLVLGLTPVRYRNLFKKAYHVVKPANNQVLHSSALAGSQLNLWSSDQARRPRMRRQSCWG